MKTTYFLLTLFGLSAALSAAPGDSPDSGRPKIAPVKTAIVRPPEPKKAPVFVAARPLVHPTPAPSAIVGPQLATRNRGSSLAAIGGAAPPAVKNSAGISGTAVKRKP
jgi:hypothetical protein